MSSDEMFEDYIEYDSEIIEVNEESPQYKGKKGARKRCRKTTPVQFDMISDFMISHDKKTIGKDEFNHLFDDLVEKLNRTGPPIHDSDEWKRVWIHYKSKNSTFKKPKQTNRLDSIDQTTSSSMAEQELSRSSPHVDIVYVESSKDHETESPLSPPKQNNEFNDKFDVMIGHIKVLNGNVESLLSEQRKTNQLLEILLEKL